MTTQPRDTPQFYLTAPAPCPYLPGLQERKVFTHLIGRRAEEMNDALTQGGFRRSQTIAYRPACESCRGCVSVRVVADAFRPSRSFRRVCASNADLRGEAVPAQSTSEQYSLFRSYLDARHADGGMADMSVLDYAVMVEDTHVTTQLIEYRDERGELMAVALTDVLADGLSMVYSFYNPDMPHRSFGSFLILDHIARARTMNLPYVYLGYWVEGSQRMGYKSRFYPQERLLPEGWARFDAP
ncbi:arginyltransferase [Pseudochelatococcus contaminans]|uniref:Aspartate/glutamate leucyltransferase n=1 Tax=Pseudochelatococcus contaminans TaxID=1538103 RepID=A0A7W6EFP7_9HYPH|nr:arginyltransferase [Pseudochelatococcus contaminans]MBB3808984.1 arginine-tRNA-protein transferase [Pseudochelatococcus contaminans]